MFKDYYEVLGVPPSASAEQIRSSFKQLALRLHPDKHIAAAGTAVAASAHEPSHTENSSALEFTEVQEAYEVLSDVARRYLYDLNYAQLAAARNQLLAQEEKRRQREEQARCARALQEREQAEREWERAAVARAAAAVAAADVPNAFNMTRTVRCEPTAAANDEPTIRSSVPSQPQTREVRPSKPSPPPATATFGDASAAAESSAPIPPLEVPGEAHRAQKRNPRTRPHPPSADKTSCGSGLSARTPPPSAAAAAHPGVRRTRASRCSTSTADAGDCPTPSVRLPALSLHKTVSLSFDSSATFGLRSTRGSGGGGGDVVRQDKKDRAEEYQRRRAVERTLNVFFADYGFAPADESRAE